jgi:serine/threonine-protein kinase
MILQGENGRYEADFINSIAPPGKFSVVFSGINFESGSPVAIKTLPSGAESSDLIALLRHESVFRFDIPGVQKIIDFKEEQENAFLISELIDGLSLKKNLKRNPFKGEWQKAVTFIIQLLDALEVIHSKSIIHADIKPSNILVADNKPVIIDFGQAIDLNQNRVTDSIKPFSMIYAAPELMLNNRSIVSYSTDVFSTGILLYEMITGELPFRHDQPLVSMTLQLNHPLPPNRRIPTALQEIINKATAKFVFKLPPSRYLNYEIKEMLGEGMRRRYQSAAEFKNDLENLLEMKDAPKKRFRLF